MIVASAILIAVAIASGLGVANVKTNAGVVPVGSHCQPAKRCIAAAFQVAVVLGSSLAVGRSAATAYGIEICLFV